MNLKTTDIIYLTNGCCESTGHVTSDKLRSLGLSYGRWDGKQVHTLLNEDVSSEDFYPLNEEESHFVADEEAPANGVFVLMGYSVLYCEHKYLMPTIELAYYNPEVHGPDTSEYMSEKEARRYIDTLAGYMKKRFHGQHVAGFMMIEYNDGANDRHTLGIMIPAEFATTFFPSYQIYKEFLLDGLNKFHEQYH